jgi:hypothetical protein
MERPAFSGDHLQIGAGYSEDNQFTAVEYGHPGTAGSLLTGTVVVETGEVCHRLRDAGPDVEVIGRTDDAGEIESRLAGTGRN